MTEAANEARWCSIRFMNGAVMRENSAISAAISEGKFSEEAIRGELSRILESPMFNQSDRLSRFLRFTVEATLAGEADMLKEYLIGTEVYDRKPSFQPSADSIVRSEARRLRAKVKEYYESVGKDNPVVIQYRPGSYVPAFRHQRIHHEDCSGWADRILGELFTQGLGARPDIPSRTRKIDVQIVFEGTVRVVRPASGSSTPTDFKPGQNVSKQNQIRKVVSISLRKSHRN
jgi:hypothetical protein